MTGETGFRVSWPWLHWHCCLSLLREKNSLGTSSGAAADPGSHLSRSLRIGLLMLSECHAGCLVHPLPLLHGHEGETELTQIQPLWSNTVTTHSALPPPKYLPVHIALIAPSFTASSSPVPFLIPPPLNCSPKFCHSLPLSLSQNTTEGQISQFWPSCVLFQGPLQTQPALCTDPIAKDSSGTRTLCQGREGETYAVLITTRITLIMDRNKPLRTRSSCSYNPETPWKSKTHHQPQP